MADEQALGADDYRALHGMLLSEDAATKAQGLALSKKLTSDEQQNFFDYQQSANKGKGELTRVDDQSPEILAAASGVLGVGRAMTKPGLSLVARGATGAKSIVSQAAPVVKYEVAKHGLSAVGVPSGLAIPIAMAVSGYKRGAGKVAAEAPVAAAEAPAAAAAAKPSVSAILSDVELARQEYAAGRLPKSVLDKIETFAARQAVAGATNAAQASPQPSPLPAGTQGRLRAAGVPEPQIASMTIKQANAHPAVATRASDAGQAQIPGARPVTDYAPADMTNEAARVAQMQSATRGGGAPANIDQAIAEAKAAHPQVAIPEAMSAPKIASEVWKAARQAGVTMSPEQNVAAFQAVKSGLSPAEAVAQVKAASRAIDPAAAFNQHFGLKTPTAEETRFPKGIRGGPPAS